MDYGISVWLCELIFCMKCPHNKTELVLKTQESTFGYCCPQCNGIFLESKGVDAFRHNFDTDCLEKAFASKQFLISNYHCANCFGLMEYVDIDNMSILICRKCKGAFFEDGQLTQVKDKYVGITHEEGFLHNFMPLPILAIYSFFKYFTQEPDSKSKLYYGWIVFISIIFLILWLVLDK